MAQISDIYLCFIVLNWSQTNRMWISKWPNCMVSMCFNFTDFILYEGVLVSSSNYFTMFFMWCDSSGIIIIAVCQVNLLWKFLRGLLQCRFVSVVDPDRHLRQTCCAFHFIPKGKAILHWFFSELNHFKLVSIIHVMSLATPSTLYYIIILAFTAFLGLICVEQVNAQFCTCISSSCQYMSIFLCFQVCIQDMSMCCPFCPMFPCYSVPCTGYSSIYLSFSCHCVTSYWYCLYFM